MLMIPNTITTNCATTAPVALITAADQARIRPSAGRLTRREHSRTVLVGMVYLVHRARPTLPCRSDPVAGAGRVRELRSP